MSKARDIADITEDADINGVTSPVGTLRVGLPFTAATQYSAGALRVYNETYSGSPFLQVSSAATHVNFKTNISAANTGDITPTAGNRFYFGTVTYRTDS